MCDSLSSASADRLTYVYISSFVDLVNSADRFVHSLLVAQSYPIYMIGVIGASSVPTIWDLYYSCFQRPRASIGGYRGLRHHLKIFSAFIGPDQRSGDAI